jgi:hypothetical protein
LKRIGLAIFVAWWFTICTVHAADKPVVVPVGPLLRQGIAVKNPCTVMVKAVSTNITGGLNRSGGVYGGLSFDSYEALEAYVIQKGSIACNFVIGGLTNNNSPIHFTAVMMYTELDSFTGNVITRTGFSWTNSFDRLNLATNHLFQLIPPAVEPVIFPVTGVIAAYAQLGYDPYMPLTVLGTTGVVWNPLLTADPMNRSRIILVFDDGQTNVYMQNGNILEPPKSQLVWVPPPPPPPTNQYGLPGGYQYPPSSGGQMYPPNLYDPLFHYYYGRRFFPWLQGEIFGMALPNSYNLGIQWTRGADMMLEVSSDLVTWTSIHSWPWNSFQNGMIVPVNTQIGDRQFFRVVSY